VLVRGHCLSRCTLADTNVCPALLLPCIPIYIYGRTVPCQSLLSAAFLLSIPSSPSPEPVAGGGGDISRGGCVDVWGWVPYYLALSLCMWGIQRCVPVLVLRVLTLPRFGCVGGRVFMLFCLLEVRLL
jgi:hypothetical protein